MPLASLIADQHRAAETPRRPRIGIVAESRYFAQRQPAGVIAALARAGHLPTILDPEDSRGDSLPGLDVLLARGRSPALLDLLGRAEAAGVATMNRRAAIAAVVDKAAMAQALAAEGIPSPATRVGSIGALARSSRASDFPLVVKPVTGDNARGVHVVHSRAELLGLPWTEPVALAQPLIASDGFDLKLYVVGAAVWAARKPSPIAPGLGAAAEPRPVTPTLRALALRCGRIFGLEVFGVDCIATPAGPVVIEVNDFPNYSGIEEADDCLARHAVERGLAGRAGSRS